MPIKVRERRCQGCGMKIEFLLGPNDKTIPAQKVKTVYIRKGSRLFSTLVGGDGGKEALYVNHFETCPKASDFSGGKS